MTRAMYLVAEFHTLVQGNLTITAYCHRLQSLSDALRDAGLLAHCLLRCGLGRLP